MTKFDLAQYLANLYQLMQGQDSTGRKRSAWLVDEYQRGFDELKQLVKDENPKEPQDPEGD